MQVAREVSGSSICEKLLSLDDGKILYSSYVDASGSVVCEATRNSIVGYDRLTVVVLPLHSGVESLTLAIPVNCDLKGIIAEIKRSLL